MTLPGRIARPVLVALIAFALAVPASGEALLAVSVEMQVLAADTEHSGRSVAAWADANGGYFTLRSLDEVVVRLPAARLPELREHIGALGDAVVSYLPSTEDLREDVLRSQAAVAARTEALEAILSYLDRATVSATLAFEQELRSLNQEIEYHQGRLRSLRNRAEYATVRVVLSARSRTVPERIPSSFAWINRTGLYSFLEDGPVLGGGYE